MSTCNLLDLKTLGSQPIMSRNLPGHCHTSIATQSLTQSINQSMRNQMPRNVSSGQLHELLIAMSWASLHCPDETDLLPSFLPFLPCDERPPEEEESKWYSYGSMRVVGLHFGSWPSKDILSKLLSHKTTEKPG